jgi:hypothetical protein
MEEKQHSEELYTFGSWENIGLSASHSIVWRRKWKKSNIPKSFTHSEVGKTSDCLQVIRLFGEKK